jgi:hypothetical protein
MYWDNMEIYLKVKMGSETKSSGSKDKRWSLKGMTALVTGATRGIG